VEFLMQAFSFRHSGARAQAREPGIHLHRISNVDSGLAASRRHGMTILVALIALALATTPAAAQDFYRGRSVNLIVGNATGGGYDAYARLLARHMPKYIPGEPTFVVRNMPGAGGMAMSNFLYSQAPRDGLTIGMMSRANPIEPVLGNPAAKFKSEDFTWLGTSSSYEDDAYCLIIRAGAPFKTIEDVQKPGRPLLMGGLAAGGTDTDITLIARDVFKLNVQLVRGYSSAELNLAIQRGEVEGRTIGMSSIQTGLSDFLREGKLRFLVQFGHEKRWKGLPDVPTAHELAKSPADKALLDLAELPFLMARPFLAPPGVPAERVQALRHAFDMTMKDPAYLAETAKLQLEVLPMGGEALQALVGDIVKTPPEIATRVRNALEK
jgi:tripartite-type tricarboxylate transporter receptor subunit TctC